MATFPSPSSEPLPAQRPPVTLAHPAPLDSVPEEVGRCITQQLLSLDPFPCVQWSGFALCGGASTKRFYFDSVITLNHVLLTRSFIPWYLEQRSIHLPLLKSGRLFRTHVMPPLAAGLMLGSKDPHVLGEGVWSAQSLPLLSLLELPWGCALGERTGEVAGGVSAADPPAAHPLLAVLCDLCDVSFTCCPRQEGPPCCVIPSL